MSNENGKGDKRRPLSVPRTQFESNWNLIHWETSKKINKVKPNKIKPKKKKD